MDPIDVCRVPSVSPDHSSDKPSVADTHESAHAAHQDSSGSDSTSSVSAGGSMSQTSAAGGKPPSGSGLTMDDVNIVGRDMKGGGGSKGDARPTRQMAPPSPPLDGLAGRSLALPGPLWLVRLLVA